MKIGQAISRQRGRGVLYFLLRGLEDEDDADDDNGDEDGEDDIDDKDDDDDDMFETARLRAPETHVRCSLR